MVASAMPGTANSTWMLFACSQGPNKPWAPNSSTKTRPEITGLTENGRSINVIRKVLPRKSNFVIAQAAITPNTRLSVDGNRRHQQRQPDRRQRLRLGQRGKIGADAFGERLREHHDQRQHDEYREEGDRQRDDDKTDRPGLGAQISRRHDRRARRACLPGKRRGDSEISRRRVGPQLGRRGHKTRLRRHRSALNAREFGFAPSAAGD